MKTAKIESGNVEKSDVKKSVNLEILKAEFSKSAEFFTKESAGRLTESIYKAEFSTKSQRTKIRNKLERFVSDILGRDRSESDRINAISDFCDFYRKHWKLADFKLENFTNSQNQQKRREYSKILEFAKLFISEK